jgi:hypothetical protein
VIVLPFLSTLVICCGWPVATACCLACAIAFSCCDEQPSIPALKARASPDASTSKGTPIHRLNEPIFQLFIF